jgi:hypothetical protein
MEKKISANVHVLELFCPFCEIPMRYSNNTLFTDPPKHIYVCMRCGCKHLTTEHFPKTKVETNN